MIKHTGKNKTVVVKETEIKVVIELEAYKKMQCYIDICNKEVGWLGRAYKVGNTIFLKDVYLFDQEVHATTCELTPGGIADFITELYNTIDPNEAMEISNNLTCWGHSHVNMGVSPSAQDESQLNSFESSGHPWFLRVIGNKKGNYEFTFIDYQRGIKVQDLSWAVNIPGLDMEEMMASIKVEVNEKVKDKPAHAFGYNRPTPYTPYRFGGESLIDYVNSNHNMPKNDLEDYLDGMITKPVPAINKNVDDRYLIRVKASGNHDTIMDIAGNNSDNINDTQYQLLDEALCMFSIDELLAASICEDEDSAIKYMTQIAGESLTIGDMIEIYSVCVEYQDGLFRINGIINCDSDTDMPICIDEDVAFTINRDNNLESKVKSKRGRPKKNK